MSTTSPFNQSFAERRAEIDKMEKEMLFEAVPRFVEEAEKLLEVTRDIHSILYPQALFLNLEWLEKFGRLNAERIYIRHALGNRTPRQRPVRGQVKLTTAEYNELYDKFLPLAEKLTSLTPHSKLILSQTEFISPAPLGISFPVFSLTPYVLTFDAKHKLVEFVENFYVAMEDVFIANGAEDMIDSIYIRTNGFEGNVLRNPALSFDKDSRLWTVQKDEYGIPLPESPFYLSDIIES